jgi:hypothetical protein
VSGGVWITGPDHYWVAEDHVLALADFLRELRTQMSHVVSVLLQIERHDVTTSEGFLASWPGDEVARVRMRLAELVQEAERLHQALWDYARATADQERARMSTFEAPRDRLLALVAITLAQTTPPSDFANWGFAQAAQAIIPEDSLFDAVSVTGTRHGPAVSPARTFAERLDRIPRGSDHSIRIERFVDQDGSIATDVYIAGTRDGGVGFTTEPFDMESNIALIAGATAASLVAVERAMSASGVTVGDKVTFVGHSQGGLIAARLAESGRYATTGLVTVGAPIGHIPVRGNYPAVAISHRDDVVPELGGHARQSLVVRVSMHSGADPGDVVGAHSLEAYRQSAAELDASPARNRLGEFPMVSGTARPMVFRAQRD